VTVAKKFVIKLFIAAIPFIALLSGFIVFDPFQIIYRYGDYSEKGYVIPNRDFISTEVYIRNKEKYHYDSFIFGSSRTLAFETNTWKRNLKNSDAHPFKFDASGETIFGIHSKIKYIDEKRDIIKSALLVFDSDVTFSRDTDSKGHLFIKHPTPAKTSWVHFYTEFLKSYFNGKFLVSYYLYKITGDYYPFMQGVIEFRKIKYDTISNDLYIIDQEKEHKKDTVGYFKMRKKIFYDRSNSYRCTKPSINPRQIVLLADIKRIFAKHRANYKIIISPLYDQLCFNKSDLLTLQNIFGVKTVYDYSGINEYTNSMYNYYETQHYIPAVGEKIMQEIYQGP
jgi:hypothetical protein